MSIEIIKKYWPGWEPDTVPLGEGEWGPVYSAVKNDRGIVYRSAIKVISVSRGRAESDAYVEGVVRDIENRLAALRSLRGVKNIVGVDDSLVVKRDDGSGWDILVRMELLTPLMKAFSSRQMNRDEAVKLGIDICSALEALEKKNMLHRDVKLRKIYLGDLGTFKLGSPGMEKKLEKTMSTLSAADAPEFVAPEVGRGERHTVRSDVYSLGMVLYVCMNGRRGPFLDVNKQILYESERAMANARRLAGDPLPCPTYAPPELSEIILKACDPDPARRYASPTEFKNALASIAESSWPEQSFRETPSVKSGARSDVIADAAPQPKKKKNRSKALIAVLAAAALTVGLGVGLFFLIKNLAGKLPTGTNEAAEPTGAAFTELPDVTPDPGAEPDFNEAYSAYLVYLTANKPAVNRYNWQKDPLGGYGAMEGELTDEELSRPVALADISGDEVPELIYVYADELAPYSPAYLKIMTYTGGRMQELYTEKVDEYLWGMSYILFRTSESGNLRMYKNGECIEFIPTYDAVLKPYVVCRTVSRDDDFDDVFTSEYYDSSGNQVTEQEYNELVSQFVANMNEIVMDGGAIIAKGSQEEIGCGAMTADEALAKLRELLGDSELGITKPVSFNDISYAIPDLPIYFETGAIRYWWGFTLNKDGTATYHNNWEAYTPEEGDYEAYFDLTFSFSDLAMENEHAISFTVSNPVYEVEPGTRTEGDDMPRVAVECRDFSEGERCVIYFPGTYLPDLDAEISEGIYNLFELHVGGQDQMGSDVLLYYVIYCPDTGTFYKGN